MIALHRSNDFNRDFDRQYRWYLAQAGEALAERYVEAVLAALRLLADRGDEADHVGIAGSVSGMSCSTGTGCTFQM